MGLSGMLRGIGTRVWGTSALVALFFSLSTSVGRRVNESENLGLGSREGAAAFVLETAVLTLLYWLTLTAFYSWLQRRDDPARGVELTPTEPAPAATGKTTQKLLLTSAYLPARLPLRSAATLRAWALLVAAWLPYWLLLWPGQVSVDSSNQIRQVLGVLPLNDHHPLEMTLAIGAVLLPLRALTGSINVSISVLTLLQLVAVAGIYALTVTYIRRVTTRAWVWRIALALFALHPVIGWYSVAVWKDVWISALLALLAAFLTDLLDRIRGGQAPQTREWVALALLVVAAGMAKKTGIYVVIPTATVTVLLLWRWRRSFTKSGGTNSNTSAERGGEGNVGHDYTSEKLRRSPLLAGGAFATGIVVYLAGHAGLIALTGAETGSPAEALSVPVQQIARTVRDHGADLPEHTRAEIEFFFPGVDLAKRYKPGLSDPVKGALDRQRFTDNKGRFVSLWFSVVRQYPATATKATLVGTRGYWYPKTHHWLVFTSDWDAQVGGFLRDVLGLDPASLDPNFQEGDEALSRPKVVVENLIHGGLRAAPLLDLALYLGYWTWAAVLLTGGLWVRRRSVGIPAVAVAVCSWGICMISPVFAEARYALPILVTLPVMLGALTSAPSPRS